MTDTTHENEAAEANGQQLMPRTSALDRPDVNLIEHSPFNSMHAFGVAQRMAGMLASSSIVPDDYRSLVWDKDKGLWMENPAAVGNCFIAIELANRLHTSPILIMQQVDMIHGRPAMRGVLLIGLVNASGQFSPLMFESRGEPGGKDPTYGYRAVATNRETGEECEGPWIDWAMVNAEGWPNKKGSKWKTMPEQMFRYRAAAFWSRIFAPHITLGLMEAEEAREIDDGAPIALPGEMTRATQLTERLERSGADAAPADPEPEPEKPRGRRRAVGKKAEPATEPPADKQEPPPAAEDDKTPEPETPAEPEPIAEAGSSGLNDMFNVE